MHAHAMSKIALKNALRAFASVVGETHVFHSEEDRRSYTDPFALNGQRPLALAAIAPANAQEVQAIVRLANQHGTPLWPISRGKNIGYGGAAPVLGGSIVLDLGRMKKIEIDAENGVVLLEPGVSFYDLYDHLRAEDIPLWMSAPGNSLGSVVGNALDRGVGYTPYGDHAARICGLEAVLPDGDLVRTGMGAMTGAPTWQLYRPGFGPSWDQMFVQSNFGVVTKLGLWLMPEPESMLGLDIEFAEPEDIGWAIGVLAPLRREGILQHSPSFGNWLRAAAVLSTRAGWTAEPGMPGEDIIQAIRKRFDIGWWSVKLRFYGPLALTRAARRIVERAFNGKPIFSMTKTHWAKGDPTDGTLWGGAPSIVPLENSKWHSANGGHIGFSPVLPLSGALALEQFKRTSARFIEFGMDHQISFVMGERHLTNVNQILFDRNDPAMMQRVDGLFRALAADAKAQGYGEYRTHIDYMDLVAGAYDFNNDALKRLNERVKDALDPNGIVAPGKSGIWPARYRGAER